MPFSKGKYRWWHTSGGVAYRADVPKKSTDKPGRIPKLKPRKSYQDDPLAQYRNQKHYAARRRISFLLTFKEWWNVWQKSGCYDERGIRADQYCMARGTVKQPDTGCYKIGNVRIITNDQNRIEQDNSFLIGNQHALGFKHTKKWRAKKQAEMLGNDHAATGPLSDERREQTSVGAKEAWELRKVGILSMTTRNINRRLQRAKKRRKD